VCSWKTKQDRFNLKKETTTSQEIFDFTKYLDGLNSEHIITSYKLLEAMINQRNKNKHLKRINKTNINSFVD